MKQLAVFGLALLLLFFVTSTIAQQPDFDTPIADCQDAEDPNVCIGDVAYTAGNAGLCVQADDPAACRDSMTQSVEILCQDVLNPQACFGTWGAQGVESACTYLPPEEQAQCYIVAAAESRDYSILDRRFEDAEQRDIARGIVAVMAYDPALAEEIDDNHTYDNARIYMLPVMGIGRDMIFPDDYCDGLRGNYGGDNPEDADLNVSLCADALAAVLAFQAADEEEQEDIFREMLEAIAEGGDEAGLDVLQNRLLGDPISDAFVRGWCRADENEVCVEGAIPVMEYDADADTITHYPPNGPPRFYENIGESTYRMYYDAEISDDDGNPVAVRFYGQIVVESPERFSWQFYNHLDRSIGILSYYIPLPVAD